MSSIHGIWIDNALKLYQIDDLSIIKYTNAKIEKATNFNIHFPHGSITEYISVREAHGFSCVPLKATPSFQVVPGDVKQLKLILKDITARYVYTAMSIKQTTECIAR